MLTDAFGSAKDLYHRLERKSTSEDDRNEPRNAEDASTRDRSDSHSNIIEVLGRHVRWSLDRRAAHPNDSEDEVMCTASSQVQATYDHAYRKLGEPYARGDDVARIQLQSHIIKLQRVLISIHQDFMLSNYLTISSSHSQLIHLVQTVRTTRGAVIQALDVLYQRMLAQPPPKKPAASLPIPKTFPAPPQSPQRSKNGSASSSNTSVHIPSKPAPKPNPNLNKLFCRYALDLQFNTHLPLSANFKPEGNRKCPRCRTYISVRPKKAWEVTMVTSGRHPRRKRFLVRNVFVVKCHREGGGFACVLCARYGDADTVCRSVGALVEHLWKEHSSEDLEKDEDVERC